MRDLTHMNQVERWARFVAEHKRKTWIRYVKPIIDSQFQINERFLKKLSNTKAGAEKIIRLYDIKNTKGYNKLLSRPSNLVSACLKQSH
jgi:hypothetical protein